MLSLQHREGNSGLVPLAQHIGSLTLSCGCGSLVRLCWAKVQCNISSRARVLGYGFSECRKTESPVLLVQRVASILKLISPETTEYPVLLIRQVDEDMRKHLVTIIAFACFILLLTTFMSGSSPRCLLAGKSVNYFYSHQGMFYSPIGKRAGIIWGCYAGVTLVLHWCYADVRPAFVHP